MTDPDVWRDAFLCGVRDWWTFAGDPWFSGAVFMAAYLGTALMMMAVARRAEGRERLYWRLCGWLFLLQVANVHADLHGLVWTTGRCLAHAQGWYGNRREVQLMMLAGLALVVVLILLLVLTLFLRHVLGNFLLTLGVAVALGFTVVKGINFHALDALYGGTYGPFRGADLIELSGIAVAALASGWRLWRGTDDRDMD